MKKKLTVLACLLLCASLLSGCANGNNNSGHTYDVLDPNAQATQNVLDSLHATETPTLAPTEDPMELAALGEEDVPDVAGSLPDPVVVTDVPRMDSEYAGATPVVIDPIDKPTATPVPPLTFTYQTYDATKLHLSFEAPVGWIVNDENDDVYMLTNPDTSVDYAASITIAVSSTASTYGASELRSEVTRMMDTLRSAFASLSASNTASRTMLGEDGIYADYKAAMDDGTLVSGRVHAVSIGRTLYVFHFSWPREYNESYKDTVYAQLRKTIQVMQ